MPGGECRVAHRKLTGTVQDCHMFDAQDGAPWGRDAPVRNEGAIAMKRYEEHSGEGQGDGEQSRRVVVKAGATAFGMSAMGRRARAPPQPDGSATPTNPALDATPTSCVLTPELTQGPYYLADELDPGGHHRGQGGRAAHAADRRVGHQCLRPAGERGGPYLALRCARLLLGCQREQSRQRRYAAGDRSRRPSRPSCAESR